MEEIKENFRIKHADECLRLLHSLFYVNGFLFVMIFNHIQVITINKMVVYNNNNDIFDYFINYILLGKL